MHSQKHLDRSVTSLGLLFFPQQTLWAEMTLYFLAISPFETLRFSSESLHRKYYFFILMLLNIYLICTDSSEWVNSCSPSHLSEGEKAQWGHMKTQPSINQFFKAVFERRKTTQTNTAEPGAPRTPLRLKKQWNFVRDSQHSGLSAQEVSWMVTFKPCYSPQWPGVIQNVRTARWDKSSAQCPTHCLQQGPAADCRNGDIFQDFRRCGLRVLSTTGSLLVSNSSWVFSLNLCAALLRTWQIFACIITTVPGVSLSSAVKSNLSL